MKWTIVGLVVTLVVAGCSAPPGSGGDALRSSAADSQLAAFIARIRAVDNHTHVNSVTPGDSDYDALPLDPLAPFELPVRVRNESPIWPPALKALYGYPHGDLSEAHAAELRPSVKRTMDAQGDKFPAWALDRIGTEVMLANRIAMGPGLAPPRFRWVSYVDALIFPLSNSAEAMATPDREKLFPLEDRLLKRYLSDLHLPNIPSTLEAYLETVVTPTLEAQRRGGCVAVKFEAAYLRTLDFAEATREDAAKIYARYAARGEPSHADYKTLQDFLFRFVAREAGRLGMAVHIHSFEGAGNYFVTKGADPLLLEPVFNDPGLGKTRFVIIHGGGVFAAHAGAMLWKPNVLVDTSIMSLAYPPERFAGVLRAWLTQFPEKVLFGSDASAFGPDLGWEVAAQAGTDSAREALALALTEMVRAGEVSRSRAEEIATMVMRTNASRLYNLGLSQ
jgi:predicted TIM-barrel fold metal-dependent hydrolase